jgi:hypothetical protein
MKAIVAMIAVLLILGIGALSMLTARQLSSSFDHGAGLVDSDQGANPTAAQPSAVMTPWPDLKDLTTSVSAAVPVASAYADQSTSSPMLSERAAPTGVAAMHHPNSMNRHVPAQHHSHTQKAAHKRRHAS